jgi:hypothetical protein
MEGSGAGAGAGSILVTTGSGCGSGSHQKHTDPTDPYPDAARIPTLVRSSFELSKGDFQQHYCTCPALADYIASHVAGVLDESYCQLTPLSGVGVQRPACLHRLAPCQFYEAWRAGMATQLSGLS